MSLSTLFIIKTIIGVCCYWLGFFPKTGQVFMFPKTVKEFTLKYFAVVQFTVEYLDKGLYKM